MEDGAAVLRMDEPRILVASTTANADSISRRIAFSRRVGSFVPDGAFSSEHLDLIRRGSYRVRVFALDSRPHTEDVISEVAARVGGRVSLEKPDVEVTVVRGKKDYIAITRPQEMTQDWAQRRPRRRPFFHPAAIFPKLSRALVNLTRVRRGETIIDPFCGTGSLLLEAYEAGATPVGLDIDGRMVRGARSNMASFGQSWLGLIKADAGRAPLRTVDAICTDVPYGRASSTSGSNTRTIIDDLVVTSSHLLPAEHRLVLMHPKSVTVTSGDGLLLEEQHHLYIHRNLTRTISVLRRD